jgi:hypothetical protein
MGGQTAGSCKYVLGLGLGRKFSLTFFRESFREIHFSLSRKILYKKTKLSRKFFFAKAHGKKSLNGKFSLFVLLKILERNEFENFRLHPN